MSKPLVSIIITTKNEAAVIERLLKSIQRQTYRSFELLIVDNYSTDATIQIVQKYTSRIFSGGPERSAQRNFGARKARGKYYLILDADMILNPTVLTEAVDVILHDRVSAVIIPEHSRGSGFWSACKAAERACYLGDQTIEAARFFEKKAFWQAGGFDETITGPEDWDLTQKIKKKFPISRIKSFIIHDEGRINLMYLAQKKYYYGQKLSNYLNQHTSSLTCRQMIYFLRPAIYKNLPSLVKKPTILLGLIVMLMVEQIAGFAGFIRGKLQ